MSKILILFCNDFSSTGDGAFILPELRAWTHSVDRIIIFSAKKSNDRVPLPSSNIEFVDLNMPTGWKVSFILFLYYGFLLLFQKRFWIELRDIIAWTPHLKNVYCAVSKYAYQKKAEAKVYQYLQRNPVSKDDNIILYSYWLDYIAGIAAELQLSANIMKRISRAHGYDLYEDQPGNGYMPWRRDHISRLDHVYTASNAGAKFLHERFPELKDKISCAYLGSEDFGFQNYAPSDTLRLISCSGLTPVKRVDKIIEALSQINDISIKWTHIGTGPEETWLKELAKQLLPPNIQCDWRGYLSHEQVKTVYQTECFDLFVSTSASEGLPVSMMEALSCGIPIVGTSVGGVPEIIHNLETGWLLDVAGSVPDLVKVIRQYMGIHERGWLDLHKSCRLFWEKHFDADQNAETFMKEMNGASL